MRIKDQIFISHASEDKEDIVEPLLKCLRSNNITNYFYDKEQINLGDSIIRKINDGLSRSKIGIIIFSQNYLNKKWTMNEMEVMYSLLVLHKIRLIPFLTNDISYETLIDDYPLLAPILLRKIEKIDCLDLIKIIRKNLDETCKIFDNPVERIIISNNNESKINKEVINKVNINSDFKMITEEYLNQLYQEISSNTVPQLKVALITEMRNYSETQILWKYQSTWKILEYLIFSEFETDNRDGLYIIQEMLKLSEKYPDNHIVKQTLRERYAHKIITLLLKDSMRISLDSFEILKMLLDESDLYNISLEGLVYAIKEIDDSNYTQYISKYVNIIEGNKLLMIKICEVMKEIIRKNSDDKIKNRALNIFEYFHKKIVK